MNFDCLETFITLAKFKNFRKTAEQLHVVQSTVSNRIQDLEKSIGKVLFIRDNKSVKLTAAGEIYLNYAKRLVDVQNTALSDVNSLEVYDDILNIGSVHSIYDCYVNELIYEYCTQFDSVAINLVIGHGNELFQKLHDNTLDIAFMSYDIKSSKLSSYTYSTDEIILVTGAKNRKFENGLSNNELMNIQLLYTDIAFGNVSNFSDINDWTNAIIPENKVFKIKSNVLSSLLPFLERDLGYAFVPKPLVSKHLADGRLIKVKLKELNDINVTTYMVVNKFKSSSLALKRWTDMCVSKGIIPHLK